MSNEKAKGISLDFSLHSFEIKDYEYHEPEQEVGQDELDYHILFRADGNIENQTLSIEFKITAQTEKKDALKIGEIHTSTTFNLSNIDKLINKDGNLIVPKGLAITFLSIALSTTRGALAANGEGTILAKEILPLADPKEMYEASPLKDAIEL